MEPPSRRAPRAPSAPRAPRAAVATGSALVRTLARLGDAAEPEPPAAAPAFAEALGQWLGWTDAIALSAVLNGAAPALATPPVPAATAAAAAAAECARVRAALERLADGAPEPAPLSRSPRPPRAPRGGPRRPAAPPLADAASLRQQYLAVQQAMQARIGALRQQLRATLARVSPPLARLAALDAAMEQALAERAQALLAGVPQRLEHRFASLRGAQAPADAGHDPDTAVAGPGLEALRHDLHQLLRAELDTRWQPIDGLLQALRAAAATGAAAHWPS
jgi:hypothetical protein